MKFEDSD